MLQDSPESLPVRPASPLDLAPHELFFLCDLPCEREGGSANRIGAYIKRGYIRPAARNADDRRGAFIHDRDSAFVACVLSEIHLTGIANPAVMRTAARRLYDWQPGETALAASPAAHIRQELTSRPSYPLHPSLVLTWKRQAEGDRTAGHVYFNRVPGIAEPKFDPSQGATVSALVVRLLPVLARFNSRLRLLEQSERSEPVRRKRHLHPKAPRTF